jgi:hypothetical protein
MMIYRMEPTPRWEEFHLRFEPLRRHLMPEEFPCDPRGHVDLDAYDNDTRMRYLYARALRGLDYSLPRMVVRSRRVHRLEVDGAAAQCLLDSSESALTQPEQVHVGDLHAHLA